MGGGQALQQRQGQLCPAGLSHTSPVYVNAGIDGSHKREAAAGFDGAIQRSLEWAHKKGRFYTDRQRQEVVDLFKEGQAIYREMGRD
jgi:hypothetical protein